MSNTEKVQLPLIFIFMDIQIHEADKDQKRN